MCLPANRRVDHVGCVGLPPIAPPKTIFAQKFLANWMGDMTNLESEVDKDNTTPFSMPAFSGRNILIFSDGTGQAGGLVPDEPRSNVYKLFRATRCGPDTNIDPDKQLAFYDPGLGSKSSGGEIKLSWLRWLYNILSSATGLGITLNVIDCYAALIQLWRPGDRIFLFGFSRGAYTVRCLGGVLGLCGIPTTMAGGEALLRDDATVRKIATEAVRRVYRHGSGASDDPTPKREKRKERLGEQRRKLGEQFRKKYNSEGPNGANVVPHFIGVWDTVAAVGLTPPAWAAVRLAALGLLVAIAASLAYFKSVSFDSQFFAWFGIAVTVLGLGGYLVYLGLRIKFATGLPGYRWYQTLHLTSFKITFFDRTLNKNVRYARHALAIDERRADFDRVPWKNEGQPPNRELEEGAWFQQYWFAGNHSDIGGSYSENESRLSDLSLGWLANEAKRAGLLVNGSLLQLFGRPNGPQHDECRVGISFLGFNFKWKEKSRKLVDNATLHWSVKKRLEQPSVQIYDEEMKYRPEMLREHKLVGGLFEVDTSETV